MTKHKNKEFWFSLLLLFLTVILSVFSFFNWNDLLFFVSSIFFIHWLGLISTFFIAVLVPIYYVLKRKRPQFIKKLIKIHVFGNLISFLFISIHFSQNTGRLSGSYFKLEDGFILFFFLSLLVATGILERFENNRKIVRYTKPIHRYGVFIFYLIALIHTLQGFNII